MEEKFKIFQDVSKKHSDGAIQITYDEFSKKEELFDRGLKLAILIKEKFNLAGNKNTRWSGTENQGEDSSDIYIGNIGVSLKDSSMIIRNSGFSQLLKVFCPNTIKEFNDPYWEFAPSLSVKYLHIIIKDCNDRRFMEVKNYHIYINGQKRKLFDGCVDDLLNMNLATLLSYINKTDIKSLIKDFSKNGNKKKLFAIRKGLVSEVSNKIIAFFSEGILQDPKHIEKELKYMLQFRDKEKIFGFSSKKFNHIGKILKAKDIGISAKTISMKESKLTDKTLGLQVNFYTDIDIAFPSHTERIILQNQLRYKHRTFTSAPEANFHLLKYKDW
ncbi:MAG: hypothetical protein OXB84_08410, partial [Halobacteriovoraceae bacterium]|nr:hypothetical protein [Halobacteriovoraceae bacterium]